MMTTHTERFCDPQLGINFNPPRKAPAAHGVEMELTYPADLSPIDYAECFNNSGLVLARYRNIDPNMRVWAIGTMSESGYFYTETNGSEAAMRREMLERLS
jgi:hypothetical protein